ncbi:MAG: hypothetical protein LBJ71_01595 [Holosporaceae bacterium]|jgi:hypothetical protein|nr:hypothetical protein [Holosporaceae bacterium]
MNIYAIILLAGILGGYASDLNAVASKPVVDGSVGESAAPPEEEYLGMENFVKVVNKLNKEENGAYLVLGDKGWPLFGSAGRVSGPNYQQQFKLRYLGITRGMHRFQDKRWAFLDMDANEDELSNGLFYTSMMKGRAVLRANVDDKAMWNKLEKCVRNTFLYIVDDFDLLATRYSTRSSLKERLDGIWHVLKSGGVLVTQLRRGKLTINEARNICEKFDVYITDDVFLSVCNGYMAQPYVYEMGVDPYYWCVRYWINHVKDDVKLNVLSAKDKGFLENLKKRSVSGKRLDGTFYKSTKSLVDEVDGKTVYEDNGSYKVELVRKMASTWKVDTLLENVERLEKVGAEFLSSYPENVAEAREKQDVCLSGNEYLGGTYLIFRKKIATVEGE